jgi:hypothetical protein
MQGPHSRDNFIASPFLSPQDGSIVCFPDSQWALGLKLPIHDPAIRIASEQATVLAHESHAVYLGCVAAQDVAGLGWWQCGKLALGGHVS